MDSAAGLVKRGGGVLMAVVANTSGVTDKKSVANLFSLNYFCVL
jgi:hypothetical protein